MNDIVSSRKTGGLAWSVTVPSLAGGERRLLAFNSQFSVFSSQCSDFAGWVRACSVLRGGLFHSLGRSASQRVCARGEGAAGDQSHENEPFCHWINMQSP